MSIHNCISNKVVYLVITAFLLMFTHGGKLVFCQENLVPNPGFENYTLCPDNQAQIERACPWMPVSNSTCEYFNSCCTITDPSWKNYSTPINYAGYQIPFGGEAYAGFIFLDMSPFGSRYSEYIYTSLTEELKEGCEYSIEFFIVAIEKPGNNTLALNSYHVCLSKAPLKLHIGNGVKYVDTVPSLEVKTDFITDTMNWRRIKGIYRAKGGEKYLTIGYFGECKSEDTLQVLGDPYCRAYYLIDNINLSYCGPDTFIPGNDSSIYLYPNPTTSDIFIEGQQIGSIDMQLVIFDLFGRKVIDKHLYEATENKALIDIRYLAAGTYVYQIKTHNAIVTKGKLIKL